MLKLTSPCCLQEVPQDSPLPGTMMTKQQKFEALLASPQDFIDIRAEKRNPRAPDFKHKSDQAVAIWLADADPRTQATVEQIFGVSLWVCFCCLKPRGVTGELQAFGVSCGFLVGHQRLAPQAPLRDCRAIRQLTTV